MNDLGAGPNQIPNLLVLCFWTSPLPEPQEMHSCWVYATSSWYFGTAAGQTKIKTNSVPTSIQPHEQDRKATVASMAMAALEARPWS
jgi:hypothetical protein